MNDRMKRQIRLNAISGPTFKIESTIAIPAWCTAAVSRPIYVRLIDLAHHLPFQLRTRRGFGKPRHATTATTDLTLAASASLLPAAMVEK
jgi:hypothetical protein